MINFKKYQTFYQKYCLPNRKHSFNSVYLAILLLMAPCFALAQTAQNIKLDFTSQPLSKIIASIEKQSQYTFFYNNDIDVKQKVSIKITSNKIEEVVKATLKSTSINYRISDRRIVLFLKSTSTNTEKTHTISGIISDVLGPVVGATITGKNGLGTITSLDGDFKLSNVQIGDVLTVSYIGYKTQNIVYNGQSKLAITMKEDTQTLDEVVVTALGIKRSEKALSYNVQQVKGEELTAVKDANFMNSMVGKVAGAEIQGSASGAGGSVRVVMRGMKSITKDNNALYVIDGVPMLNNGDGGGAGVFANMAGTDAVADINSDDIESVNMMTGPAAAALYGNAAANGVVLINTKKGQKEKTTVTVSNSTIFSKVNMLPEMQNSYGTSNGIQNWGEKEVSNYDPKKFFNTGANIINSISLSTGSQKNQTYLSASTTNSSGTLPNNSYERYNFTARNTTSFLKDKLVLDFGANYIIQKNTNMVSQGQYYNPLPALYLFPRSEDFDEIRLFERWDINQGYMVQQWNYGDNSLSMQNPYWTQRRILRESSKKRYMLNASLKWNITDWMNIVGRVNLDNSDFRNRVSKHASTLTTFCGINGGYEDRMIQDRSIYADALLNIDKTFGDYRLNANIGTSIYDVSSEMMGYAGDLISPNFFALNNINYKSNYKPLQNGWHDQTQSIFANVELGYRSMLYLTLTGRADWESKLAYSDNQSFFYPSVGLSAVLTEMFKLPEFISYAKIRGSLTEVATPFERYLTNPRYVYNEQSHNWANPTTFPATNLKPENTRSWEIGLNAKFWNRVSLDVTYYRSNTYNQTFRVTIPASSGYSNAIVQTGNVENKGIEMAIGYDDKWGHFSWSSHATLTLNRNKVKRLASGSTNPVTNEVIQMPELKMSWLGKANVAPQVILKEGGTMTDIYVYNHLKTDNNGNIYINPQTGNFEMITEKTPKKVGTLAPDYNVGWSNNFGYKGINLGVVVSARVGGTVYSATQGVLDYYGASQVTANMRDNGGVWINRGMADTKKFYQTIGTGEGGYGQYYLYSATNVRLQELSLSYTLPKKLIKGVADISLGLVGRNLWMIYCKAPFDPELSASTSSNFYQNVDYFMQPSTRNIGFNVKVQF